MKLPFVMGTELTGINYGYREGWKNDLDYYGPAYSAMCERRSSDINEIRRAMRESQTKYTHIDEDDHCIEIASRKIETYEDFESFSVNARQALYSNFYFPKSPEAVCGGAHIHVGIPRDSQGFYKQFKYHLCRDLVMRPYLPWVFGEPDEEGAMNTLINAKEHLEDYIDTGWNNIGEYLDALNKPFNFRTNYVRLSDDADAKDKMFRLSPFNTIEFRFFEMTETWEEQELQLHFVCQYMKWMYSRYNRGYQTEDIKLMYPDDLQDIRPGQAVEQFEELCYNIDLNFEDYKPFIKRNLYPRWQNGRMRI